MGFFPLYFFVLFMLNPHILLLITVLGWAGNAIAGKYAVGHISPMMLTFLRWFIAFIVLSMFAWRGIRQDWHILRNHLFYFFLMGSFGYASFNFLLYSSLHYTSSINVAIEQTAMPLFIFFLNFLLYRTKATVWQMVGYWLTFIGVIVAVTHGNPFSLFTQTTALNRGDLLMLIAALFYSGYSVGLRHQPSIRFSSFLAAMIAGGVIFSLLGLAYEVIVDQFLFPATLQGWSVVLYTGIVPSLVSQGCFIMGVAALGANRAGLYINFLPVMTALLAVVLLHDNLHFYHLFAFLLTASGVTIAAYKHLESR